MFDRGMFTTIGRYKPLLISNKQYRYVQVVFIYALNDCSVYTRCKNVWQDAGSGNIGWFLWWLLLSFIIFEIIDFYELIETCTCTYTPSLK